MSRNEHIFFLITELQPFEGDRLSSWFWEKSNWRFLKIPKQNHQEMLHIFLFLFLIIITVLIYHNIAIFFNFLFVIKSKNKDANKQ